MQFSPLQQQQKRLCRRRSVSRPTSYVEPSSGAKLRQGHVFFPLDDIRCVDFGRTINTNPTPLHILTPHNFRQNKSTIYLSIYLPATAMTRRITIALTLAETMRTRTRLQSGRRFRTRTGSPPESKSRQSINLNTINNTSKQPIHNLSHNKYLNLSILLGSLPLPLLSSSPPKRKANSKHLNVSKQRFVHQLLGVGVVAVLGGHAVDPVRHDEAARSEASVKGGLDTAARRSTPMYVV